MKKIFALLAFCTFTQGALAVEPNCQAIESTNGRLACYDAAFPPKKQIRNPNLIYPGQMFVLPTQGARP
jgi:nucleoid-associated protein YgaU